MGAPASSSDHRQRVEALFLAAAELESGERTRYLESECNGDRALLNEVQSLLGHHSAASGGGVGVGDGFLDSKAAPGKGLLTQLGATGLKGDEPLLPADRRLGQYTVRGVLGQGGMGVVYLAEQDRPRRTVALKVMRRGMSTEKLARRFEFEAELLGKLHHPGIAQVYEAGTFRDGQTNEAHPFIAMELVRGKPLLQHAAEKKLDVRQRLALMARVCDAIQHAHMSGVIHRDLKPANIMVNEDGQPKILDFGVARAIDREAAVTTIQTSVGQIIGTLPYMSPEQIAGDQSEVDTRSDVYGLGVVLYELLTGRLPHELRNRSLPEAARMVREAPPTRLSTIDRTLRGDVDTIVSKALAKEKYRRYQSAADLGADLTAYLEGRPISARQDSAFYVLRKQINRYKGAVAAVVVFLLGVLGFAVYANVQAIKNAALAESEQKANKEAQASLKEATTQRERADTAAERLREELSFANIERGRLLGLSGNLAGAEALLWPEHLKRLDSHQTFYALWELYSHTRSVALLEPNGPRTTRMAMSHDGTKIYAAGEKPAVVIWEVQSFERLGEIEGTGALPTAIAASRTGPVALGDNGGRIAVFDSDGRPLVVLRESGPAVAEVAFTPDGHRLVATTSDGAVSLFDLAGPTPGIITSLFLPRNAAGRVAFGDGLALSPDGSEVAVATTDALVRLYATSDLAPLRSFPNPDDANPAMAWSPDGALIAVGGTSRLTRLMDARTGAIVRELNAPNGGMSGVAFSPDGRRVVTCGWWYAQVWTVADGAMEQQFSINASAFSPTISPDGNTLYVALPSGVRGWDLDPRGGQTRIEHRGRTLICFSPTGELISAEGDGSVNLLSDSSGEVITQLGKANRRIRAIAISPTAPIAAACGVDGVLMLFDLAARAEIGRWPGYKMVTNDGMRFSPDGKRLVVSAANDSFKVLSIPGGEVLATIPRDGGEALAAAFSPDGTLVATTTRRQLLRLYNSQTGALVRECEAPGAQVWSIVFTADGKHVLSGAWDRAIRMWSVETGRIVRRLEGHSGLVTDLVFRPREANVLASCGADGKILLWDLNLPQNTPVLQLEGFDGWEVWAIDFDPRTPRLMGTNSLGTTVIWNLRHFNRHIGGNMGAQIRALGPSLGDGFDEAKARSQARVLIHRGKPPDRPKN